MLVRNVAPGATVVAVWLELAIVPAGVGGRYLGGCARSHAGGARRLHARAAPPSFG